MSRSAESTASAIAALLDAGSPVESVDPVHIPSILSSLLDGEPPWASLVDAAISATGAERGFLLRRSEEEWEVTAARTFEGEEVLHPLDKVIRPLVDRCRDRGESFITDDLTADDAWPALERERAPRTRALQIHPLPDGTGALYLDHRFHGFPGDPGPTRLACLLSILSWMTGREQHRIDGERLVEELRQARAEGGLSRSIPPAGDRGSESEDVGRVLIVGNHPEIVEVQALIDRVAPSDAPILVTGESGTGKELVARSIHERSKRAAGPFISENCGAITETLLESELFGCVKGAYTGADEDRPGLFELASGGTIFLDEIGDTSPGLQKKLLRVLQEGLVRRVGGQEPIPVDVRVLSATNRNLYDEVQLGEFREDLFYRLNVINIQLPPLRERREDVPLLAEHFLRMQNERSGLLKESSPEWIEALLSHHWPGNIRELQNEVRRSHALSGAVLEAEALSRRVGGDAPSTRAPHSIEAVLESGSLKSATEEFEKSIIEAALKRFRGNRVKVSESLSIPKTTLYAKIRRYDLE